ncbi:hypothetical protein R6Z07F_004261 [Ovis aries]
MAWPFRCPCAREAVSPPKASSPPEGPGFQPQPGNFGPARPRGGVSVKLVAHFRTLGSPLGPFGAAGRAVVPARAGDNSLLGGGRQRGVTPRPRSFGFGGGARPRLPPLRPPEPGDPVIRSRRPAFGPTSPSGTAGPDRSGTGERRSCGSRAASVYEDSTRCL